MTSETKKTTLWTGGAMAGFIVLLAVLWAAGILQSPLVQ